MELQHITPTTGVATSALNFFPQTSEKSSSRAHWIHEKAKYSQTDNDLTRRAGKEIKAIGVAVFQAIQGHADFLTGESCPTIEMLMNELDLSEPTVIKYIALLETCKMITKRQTRWGNREQGPKSRSFYRVLPSTLWDFSRLKKKIKVAPKQTKADLKEIKPNKKQVRDDNHESQKSTSKGQEPENDVPVISSTGDEGTSSLRSELAATLIAKGFAPERDAVALAEEVPDICRAALEQLAKARVPKRDVGPWLRTVITRQRDAQGRTPEGFEPSEADKVNQRKDEKKKPAEPVAPIVRELVAKNEQERQEAHGMACDEVYAALAVVESEKVDDERRNSVSTMARQFPSSPSGKKECLAKQRQIVSRGYPLRVESVMRLRFGVGQTQAVEAALSSAGEAQP
jgi:hypothetical protein